MYNISLIIMYTYIEIAKVKQINIKLHVNYAFTCMSKFLIIKVNESTKVK